MVKEDDVIVAWGLGKRGVGAKEGNNKQITSLFQYIPSMAVQVTNLAMDDIISMD